MFQQVRPHPEEVAKRPSRRMAAIPICDFGYQAERPGGWAADLRFRCFTFPRKSFEQASGDSNLPSRGRKIHWADPCAASSANQTKPKVEVKSPLLGRAIGALQVGRWWNSAADLPDMSKCFPGQSIHAGDPPLLCMGLFSIFWLGAGAALTLQLGSGACRAVACRPHSPPSPFRASARQPSLASLGVCGMGLPGRSSRSERRLVGPAGLEPATRPL